MTTTKKTTKKVTKKTDKSCISVNVPNIGEMKFRAPNVEDWDRYIAKQNKNELAVSRRELTARCCVSHEPEKCHEIIKKIPALPKKIAIELEDIAGAFENAIVDDDNETASILTPDGEEIVITAPSQSQWESLENANVKSNELSKKIRDFISELTTEPSIGVFEKYPALPTKLLDGAARLAGAGLEIEVKKD